MATDPRQDRLLATLWALLGIHGLIMAASGFALMTGYVPSVEEALPSLRYLTEVLPAGAFLRGMHVYGASGAVICAMLLLAVAHGKRAYRWPSPQLWWLALVALAVILGFNFTGSLLPWTQHAYWDGVVRSQIIGSVPGVGPLLATVIKGGETVGASMLAKFYMLHVSLLPIVLLGVWLVAVKQGAVSALKPVQGPLLAIVLVAFFAILTLLKPAYLGDPANVSDASFVPRPEWWFLPLFALRKAMEGPGEVIAILIIPGLITAWLVGLPWIDSDKLKVPLPAIRAMGVALLVGFFGMLGLGLVQAKARPVLHDVAKAPKTGAPAAVVTPEGSSAAPTPPAPGTIAPLKPLWVTPERITNGEVIYAANGCASCHQLGGKGIDFAPVLDGVGLRHDTDYHLIHFRNPKATAPKSGMPAFKGTDDELLSLTAYM
ncbi:MAG: cytochrome b N-terminal domain-containing protein, partial [bacterium]